MKHLENDAACFKAGFNLALDGLRHLVNRPEFIGDNWTAEKIGDAIEAIRGQDIFSIWENLNPAEKENPVDPLSLWSTLLTKGGE